MAETLTTLNKQRWDNCKINASKDATFTSVAKRLSAPEAKARYLKVQALTGVPWWFIAVTHEREASQNWNTQLGQGDPLNRVSTHVPKGRGPFNTWEEGAVDALTKTAPFSARNKDWSAGAALTELEKYNGLGYSKRGIPSPYIWAGTNQYTKGKYVADGVFDPEAVDKQLGCAGLLIKMDAFKRASAPTVTPSAAGAGAAGAIVVTGATAAAVNSGYSLGYIIGGVILVAVFLWLGACVYAYNHKKDNTNV